MRILLKQILSVAIILMLFIQVGAQIPVGTWRDHLPYSNGQSIAIANSRVYCATNLALFYYDTDDNSVNKLSKINKLSDLGVGFIAYSDDYGKLMVGYSNGNIDIIDDDVKYNYPDIKLKSIIADKTINHILISGKYAYLSTGFGIVVFNFEKDEFADTYIIGSGGAYSNINNTAIYNNHIYALTDNGVFVGDLGDPFLANFENWNRVDGLLSPNEKYFSSAVFNKQLLLVNSINKTDSCHVNVFDGQVWDTVFTDKQRIKSITSSETSLTIVSVNSVDVFDNNLSIIKKFERWDAYNSRYAIYDEDDNLWVADTKKGLILNNFDNNTKNIAPNGPANEHVFKIYDNNGVILVAPGGYNAYYPANVYSFNDELWFNLADDNKDSLKSLKNVFDFASQQNSNYYMGATLLDGLIEVANGEVINVYDNSNTEGVLGDSIGGLTYDNDGNLYIISNYSTFPFVVKTADNNWYHYQYDPDWADMVINSSSKLINTNNNDKWTISSRGKGIFVWNDNQTPEYEADDVYKMFDLRDELNSIISNKLNDIVQDIEGVVWIANDDGIAVYDNPQYALGNEYAFYARRPQIVVDGYLKSLLEGEFVTSIAVDGANRKWIGTQGGGLFLVSADGTEQIMLWNVDNSKLFSNNISSIDINQKTGEVFIGTDKGLQSYKGTSTESKSDYSNIYAFPNPVKGDYNGVITIRGLMYQTNVKITDMSGHLVFETISNGGDAIWNGKDMSGNKVASGIYLVLCVNEDGTQSEPTKIMIIK